MALIELPHADRITGALSELLQFVTHPVENTLADVDVYRGRAVDELFPAPSRRPKLTVSGRWRLPGIVAEDLVFSSLHVPLEPRFAKRYRREDLETHQVYARRIRPLRSSRRPRLLYVHGYMQPETYLEEMTLLTSMALALDVELVQIQPAYHGRRSPRRSRFSGELFWTADIVRSVEALRQTVLDARTLLSLMLAEDDRPVGVAGLSLGGALTMTLACVEPRFAFAAPMIGHMDLHAMVRDVPVLGRMRREMRSFGWELEDFREFIDDLRWNALRPQVDRDRILIVAASDDLFFAPRVVESTWQSWGEPTIRWYPTSHMGFLPRLPQAIREVRALVDVVAES